MLWSKYRAILFFLFLFQIHNRNSKQFRSLLRQVWWTQHSMPSLLCTLPGLPTSNFPLVHPSRPVLFFNLLNLAFPAIVCQVKIQESPTKAQAGGEHLIYRIKLGNMGYNMCFSFFIQTISMFLQTKNQLVRTTALVGIFHVDVTQKPSWWGMRM